MFPLRLPIATTLYIHISPESRLDSYNSGAKNDTDVKVTLINWNVNI